MGLFDKFKAGLQKTHSKLVHEIKRIVTDSPKLTGTSLEQLEAALLGADLGLTTTQQIVAAVRKAYETQGSGGVDVFTIARGEVEKSLSSNQAALRKEAQGLTVVPLDGSTGMNALNQAREFNKAVKLTGLIITKLDGTSKGGMAVAIQKELGLPIKFIGVGEQPDDLQPFDAKQFAAALFEE